MSEVRKIKDKDLAQVAGGVDVPVDIAELVDLPRGDRRLKVHKAGPQFDIGPNTPDEIESEGSGSSGAGPVGIKR